jgi:hypothetical protein
VSDGLATYVDMRVRDAYGPYFRLPDFLLNEIVRDAAEAALETIDEVMPTVVEKFKGRLP